MRCATRILIAVAAASLVAVAAPAAAGASTSSGAFFDSWGPYHSSDHRAEAQGQVKVETKSFKRWSWKTVHVPGKVCKWRDGEKNCWWGKKKDRKRGWEWESVDHFDVRSRLHNDQGWGKNKCAWETFKVVTTGGDTYFERFKNCDRRPRHFSFSGKDAAHIYVNVSRGDHWGPKGWSSGWQDVYHAV